MKGRNAQAPATNSNRSERGSFIMAKNNAWTTSLEKAKRAEEVTRLVYEKMGWKTKDVRNEPNYQEEDIDFVFFCDIPGHEDEFTVESKSDDTYQYGNFAFENIKNTDKGTLGWALTTTAQYITIYYPTADVMYILDGPKTVEWFRQNQHLFPEKKNSTARREGGVLYKSKFRIVNRERFERESGAVLDVFFPSKFLQQKAS